MNKDIKNIFIINGGQCFGHSGGRFNKTLANTSIKFFDKNPDFSIRYTDINDPYDPETEVEKYMWADVVIYHTLVWWF